ERPLGGPHLRSPRWPCRREWNARRAHAPRRPLRGALHDAGIGLSRSHERASGSLARRGGGRRSLRQLPPELHDQAHPVIEPPMLDDLSIAEAVDRPRLDVIGLPIGRGAPPRLAGVLSSRTIP